MAALRIVIFGWASSVHVQRWAKGLSERGLQVKVVSLGGAPIEGVDTTIIPRSSRLSYITGAHQAARAARDFNPDIVHAHYATGFGWWGLKSEFHPLVVSVWGSDLTDFARRMLVGLLVRKVLSKAERITATGQMLKEACLSLDSRLESKIDVIPFGVTIPQSLAPRPEVPPYRICYTKGHRKIYGPDILLKAFARAMEEAPDIELTMAGEGELTGQLKQLAERLNIAEKVAFTGFIENSQIYRLLQEHHLLVMPSLSEAFGVAALEASACGLPVIASHVGGVPEVVREGISGFLVPPGDVKALSEAIVKLAHDPVRGQLMGESGREFVQHHYDWERSLDRMIALYQELADGKR